MATDDLLQAEFAVLKPLLDRRVRRIWAGVEARAIGRSGITQGACATGLSRTTMHAGVREIEAWAQGSPCPAAQLVGGLGSSLGTCDSRHPISPIRWICRSATHLATGLQAEGHPVSEWSVNRLLHAQGYSLPGNCKTWEGASTRTETHDSNISARAWRPSSKPLSQ